MSTWLYLECADHDPPLLAEDESGQHLYDLDRIRADLFNRVALAAEFDEGHLKRHTDNIDEYFQYNTASFLARHKKCRIRIRDEYGSDKTTFVVTK